MGGAVFVVDGHDIELCPDTEAVTLEVEGYAVDLDFVGADGTVYEASTEGPEWGRLRLDPTQANRLEGLVHLLRAEADFRGLPLPPGTPDDPEAIWGALLAAQQEQQDRRRESRGRWWKRQAKEMPPKE